MAGEIVTPDQSSQTNVKPMGSISILLVDDDTACLAIVAAILKTWKYDVVTVKHPMEALCTLRGREGTFDLVVTDVHMPDMNGFQLQKKIDEEFNLPVVFMSADDQESVILRGLQSGAAFFLLKPISPNDLKNLWQYAVAKRKPKSASTEAIEITPETSQAGEQASNDPGRYQVQGTSENEKGSNEEVGSGSLLRTEDRKDTNYSKRKYLVNFEEEENEDDYGNPKKPKVVWTNALHNQFLEAIRCVGIERAVPKKILELMNVPGLTRENIASHLQKYRIFLKRVSEASTKIQSASERSMIERTFRSNFAVAQPYLKPNFSAAQLGKSLQANLSYSNPQFASSTDSPPMFGSGQSRLLLNQTNFKHPLVGTAKPLYHQPNFSPVRMESTVHPTTGLLLNGNGKFSGGIVENFVQPYQQKDFVVLESCPNDPVAGYENIGDFSSSNFNLTPNHMSNAGYVGYRLASDGRLVGLSADLNPGHGSTNVVQSESTGNVPIQLVGLSDELNPNHGSINVVQSETTSNVPALEKPNHGVINVFQNKVASDVPIRLIGLSVDLNLNHGSINLAQSESTSNVAVLDDPNHSLINVVQSEITSNVPVQLVGLSDELNRNHCLSNVGQTEITSNVPVLDDPNHVLINEVQSEITRYFPVQLVGLSANLNLNHGSTNVVQSKSTSNVPIQNDPNHGSINVVQSGSTCHVRALNDSFDYYLGQGASSTGLESGCFVLPTLANVVQDGNTSAMPLSPSILVENAFENEGESDCIFSLLDNNVLNSICEVDDNHNFLQTYGKYDFDILSDINIIQPPIQDDVEVIDYAFSSSPDDHADNIPIANNNQCLEQQLGREMMFSDLGMNGVDDNFQAYDQTFDQTFPQLEDEDFLDTVLFGTSEFNGYDMP